jgi:predicted GNAT superfamily acetyltransferase
MEVVLLNAAHPDWGRELEHLGLELGAGGNPSRLPYHFLYVTFSRIGGVLAVFREEGGRVGAGFLFPRPCDASRQPPRRRYMLRFHHFASDPSVDGHQVSALCSAALGGAEVVFFDPAGTLTYTSTHQAIGAVDIGRPDQAEAAAIRDLQQAVWGSPPEFLYPSDLHSVEFAAGTSLVARVDGALAGFLFGFYKFGGGALPGDWEQRFHGTFRLESQAMAVQPAHRGLRVAFLLKKVQAEQAWREGIGIVNWTADPLQYPNGALNFGLLRAVAFDFAPDLYPFRNELNRVHASRLGLTWLVGTERVRHVPLVGSRAEVLDLHNRGQIPRTNDGLEDARFDLDAPIIAFEVPAGWTGMQQEDVARAQAWRTLTDALFQHYIGIAAGKYVLTGVGTDGDRRFLIAEQAGANLWERLGRVDNDTSVTRDSV